MNRRRFTRLLAGVALGLPFIRCTKEKNRKPNVLLIVTDDQGYSDLGCFGGSDIKTPHLDKLASEGLRLTSWYVTCSVCTPSRSGLLTGRYPHRNGLFENIRNNMVNYKHRYKELEYVSSPEMTQGLDLREVTIAQVLKKAGYKTGIVGKWDSGRAHRYLPLQRGFDFFYGFANTGIDYWTHERYGIPSMYCGNKRIKEKGYATDLFKREAIRFIERNKQNPFFLYVAFNAPHSPSNLERTGPQAPENFIQLYQKSPTDKRTRYMANVTCMDAAVGEILKKIRESGLENDTLVLFFSDNGAGSTGDNSPLRGGKGSMYEGGLRVPFIAKWPGYIPKGVTSNEFCCTLDLFPTLLDITGVKANSGITLDGHNILNVLTKQKPSPRKELFWELRGKRAARIGHYKWALETQDKRWELPKDETGELYDLSKDKGEQRNLSADKPELEEEIRRKWQSWMQEMANAEPRGPFSKAYYDLILENQAIE